MLNKFSTKQKIQQTQNYFHTYMHTKNISIHYIYIYIYIHVYISHIVTGHELVFIKGQ